MKPIWWEWVRSLIKPIINGPLNPPISADAKNIPAAVPIFWGPISSWSIRINVDNGIKALFTENIKKIEKINLTPEKNAIPKEAIALIRSMYIIAFFLLPFLNREVINSKDIKLTIVLIEVIYPAFVILKFLSIRTDGAHAPKEWLMKKKIIDRSIIIFTVFILINSL